MMPELVTMVSHDQKIHVTCHFDHLDLRNAMVPLMVLSTPQDADTNAVVSHDRYTNASCEANVDVSSMLHTILITLT